MAVVWAGLSPTVQAADAAGTVPAGETSRKQTTGTAMDEAAWEAALAAGAAVSAVHGRVAQEPAAQQAPAPASSHEAEAAPAVHVESAPKESAAPSATGKVQPPAVKETASADAGAAGGVVQQRQQESMTAQPTQKAAPGARMEKAAISPEAALRVREIMQKFRLSGDPRSGAYSWGYTSPTWTAEAVSRPAAGSSYFLLAGSENLRFQSFDCDEVWYFYEGCGMKLTVLLADGAVRTFVLGVKGEAMPMILIPKGQIFAAENADPTGYSFISCVTIPALETAGIRVWQREELLTRYPQARETIERYTDAPWGAVRMMETVQTGGETHG